MSGVSLSLKNVTRTFREGELDHIVLNALSIDIAPGSTVAITGPSGVGKSTLLHLIGTLDTATSGHIVIGDTDTVRLSPQQRAIFRTNSIGFIFQFHHLLAEFSVLENLLLPVRIRGGDLVEATKQAMSWLEKVDLANRSNSSVSVLSGGEAQRVATLRAMMNRPGLLLADEPTGNLDGSMADRVVQLLFDYCHETGATLLLATHHSGFAERCSRWLRLGNGRVVEDRPGTESK